MTKSVWAFTVPEGARTTIAHRLTATIIDVKVPSIDVLQPAPTESHVWRYVMALPIGAAHVLQTAIRPDRSRRIILKLVSPVSFNEN